MRALAFGLLLSAAFAGSAAAVGAAGEGQRGVHRADSAVFELRRIAGFDPADSAALFVGVGTFTQDPTWAEVPFAVDDAIDLAHLFSLELGLVPPGRALLLLSGEPKKAASQVRLAELLAAGVRSLPATLSSIYGRLEEQIQAAGSKGFLIISLASHGYSVDGIHHLAASDSLVGIEETTVIAQRVFDRVARSRAARRLVFLDACRERLIRTRGQGAGKLHQLDSAMSRQLAAAIGGSAGQVIFSAATPGGYACEDFERRNGVFTEAVVDGLQCQAESDRRGFVTASTLADYVSSSMAEWSRRQGSGGSICSGGIEVNLGGPAAELPLAFCRKCLPPEVQPSHLRTEGDVLTVFSQTGERLWVHKFASTQITAQVADLQGDCKNEVVVGASGQGADAGKVVAFDFQGKELWLAAAPREFIYEGSHGGEMSVRALEVADLFGDGRRQTVVLYLDSLGWYPARLSVFDADGETLSSYFHPGHLHFLKVGSRTPAEAPQILVGGVNNDLRPFVPGEEAGHPAVVFALDPRRIRGRRAEAPPYLGSIGEGDHSWYGVLLPKNVEIERLEMVDRDGDGSNEICVWTKGAQVLYLDFAGHAVLFERGEGFQGSIRFGLVEARSRKELLSPGGPPP